ncbi:MAG: hypothetical protein FWG98_01080 [Candidatus Cloacimonetes bacterium]|nr:hypothetical protein [Candidatus Cloacimonadota bacterium]
MIDIHNHILPGLDDGSPHEDVTAFYIDRVVEAKMEGIVFTPHYMRGFYNNTKDKILDVYQRTRQIIERKGYILNTYCAAEIYLVGNESIDDIQINSFMINGSRYVLVENSLTGFSYDLYENLYKLGKLGFKPILAHPERYVEIKEKPLLAEEFMHRDVYLQINTGSLLGLYGNRVKDVSFELIDRGYAHFLGTDCHCQNGVYDFPEAIDVLRKIFGDKTADLLGVEYPQKMLNNEDLPHFYNHKQQIPLKKNFFQRLFKL